jgi:hypothetical protein
LIVVVPLQKVDRSNTQKPISLMKISFLTTSSLATNPRLVKEVLVAQDIFAEVEVICFQLGNWSDVLDEKVKLTFKKHVNVVSLSALNRPFIPWFLASLSEKFASCAFPCFNKAIPVSAIGSNKRSLLLLYNIQKSNLLKGADLIMGHNIGTLYPAYFFSRKYKIPFAFDVEDYHPGESINIDAKNEKKRRLNLMKQLLPRASFITVASPLIGEEVNRLSRSKYTLINNSFFGYEFVCKQRPFGDKIKLVWFSQNISPNRGLELLLPAIDAFEKEVKLTLIGNLDQDFADKWLKDRRYIEVIPPMEQIELHKELSKHDIGLALELRSADFNREIALTNKIFAYKQAGLFIIATDTKAQRLFLSKFADDGFICDQTVEGLQAGVEKTIKDIFNIRNSKELRFHKAKSIAYENEAEKLKTLWLRAVNNK